MDINFPPSIFVAQFTDRLLHITGHLVFPVFKSPAFLIKNIKYFVKYPQHLIFIVMKNRKCQQRQFSRVKVVIEAKHKSQIPARAIDQTATN